MATPPKSPPKSLPNLWNVFNLRESPYFQATLGGADHAYPLSLFVGRAAEVRQLLTAIGSARSSRQAVGGSPGIGKTTLVQYVKAEAIAAGYWAASEIVPFYETDTTEQLLGRLLSTLYDTILSAKPALSSDPAMQGAQQLVKVARLNSGGGNVSVAGFGAGMTKNSTPITPPGAMLFDGPRIIRDLLTLADASGSKGVVLHLNNLENLTDNGANRAADILRSLRDQLLLIDGLHILLLGTPTAVVTATATHTQVRSVFTAPLILAPLSIDDVQAMLAARYSYLALKHQQPVPPISPEAVEELYPLFRGDLRSLLNALEDAARLLVGELAPGVPIPLDALRPALQQWYIGILHQQLDEKRVTQFEMWAAQGVTKAQTQRTLASLWKLSQGAVSNSIAVLEKHGYVVALPRTGKTATSYMLTGTSQLIVG
jgi:hypothetical protein